MLNSSPSTMHSLPNFLEGESRHKSSTKQQQTHVRVRHPSETFSFTSFSASVSTFCKSPDLYFFWTMKVFPKFLLLNLKQAFKVKNFSSYMTMHYHCHWSHALYQVLVRMLIQKRPLLTVYNSLTHCRIPMI